MDDAACSGVIAAGLPEGIIVVTGNPGFDELASPPQFACSVDRAPIVSVNKRSPYAWRSHDADDDRSRQSRQSGRVH
jgi:hypothetical protein